MAPIGKDTLGKIVELANAVPQEYRQKCFELLLSRVLQDAGAPAPAAPPAAQATAASKAHPKFVLPIDVRALLSQYGVDEAVLWKCFHAEDGELRPIYKLATHKKAQAQIEHALMMALESAMSNGQFQVVVEALRERCSEHKCYDRANFMHILKRNAGLFKKIGADPLVLSSDGKAALAELLESLSA